jgi:arsenite/tail-anchored protein-transporting ATPase
MTPRTILYTGKGGVGKTSVAASTARRCATAGLRTLVMSTDPAHSLSESLGVELASGDPVDAGSGLWVLEVDAQTEMTRHWAGVQDWLGGLLIERGIDRISAEELTVPPGMDELFSLLRLQQQHSSGDWQAIIVDCAPTGETLRMLSFPEVARWWLGKAFPAEHRLLAAAAPLARSVLDIPLPSGAVMADIHRLSENLIAMNEILRDGSHTTMRLVMAPDRMVIGEAMRTFTYLNLYGFLTDAIVVNKVFPASVGDYFARWRELQEEQLDLVRSAFAPVPVLQAPYFDQEVLGVEMLDRLSDSLFGVPGDTGETVPHLDRDADAPLDPAATGLPNAPLDPAATRLPNAPLDPAAVLHESITQSVTSNRDGAVLRLALPFARKDQISLKQVGPELVVSVPGQRRTIVLPSSLAAMRPTGAHYNEGALEVTFSNA